MPESVWALLLLLPVAAASGWYVRGRRVQPANETETPPHVDYLRGIHHLVNDDSDRAIEAFVRALDVDNDTVETHLALGKLDRKSVV